METVYKTIEELKKHYPDEWVLLGNPKITNAYVLEGGIILYHSKDKKKVFYAGYTGQHNTTSYEKVTITFISVTLKEHLLDRQPNRERDRV